jgi:hypothetical protein
MIQFLGTKLGISTVVLLAEAGTSFLPTELTPLVNVGAIGTVLAWFLLKLEPRMRKQEEAMDRQSRMLGFVVIALKSVHPAVREQVEAVVKEIEDAEAARKK